MLASLLWSSFHKYSVLTLVLSMHIYVWASQHFYALMTRQQGVFPMTPSPKCFCWSSGALSSSWWLSYAASTLRPKSLRMVSFMLPPSHSLSLPWSIPLELSVEAASIQLSDSLKLPTRWCMLQVKVLKMQVHMQDIYGYIYWHQFWEVSQVPSLWDSFTFQICTNE